jgi:hypothetical protein
MKIVFLPFFPRGRMELNCLCFGIDLHRQRRIIKIEQQKLTHSTMQRNSKSTLSYQRYCVVHPISHSFFVGSVFTAISLYNSPLPYNSTNSILHRGGTYIGTIYLYYALQCPMEAIHGKSSAIHNGVSAGMISFIALHRQMMGVPFIPAHTLMVMPPLTANILGSTIYGAMAFLMAATLGGKSI